MKFRITFKDPDGVSNALFEEADNQLLNSNLDDEERAAVREIREEKIGDLIAQWVTYNEYITIEFDTEANTATVLKGKDK